MKVPYADFSEQHKLIKAEIQIGFDALFESGNFILGEEVKKFEGEFSSYCDSKYGVGVNSGTDALYLALSALGVREGDEVIIPNFTFIATALCVSYTGATPVLADIDPKTFNLDPQAVKEAITDKTKAIIPVHIYGQSANMYEINTLAREHGIYVVEDAAQAHGALYNGKKAGALGDVACFSFYPTKALGAYGDAGMVVTQSEEVYEKIIALRNYGRKAQYEHNMKGFNSRMDAMQAIVLSAKLKYLDQWNTMRRDNALYYRELLQNVDEVTLLDIDDKCSHVHQTFAVRVKDRARVMDDLKTQGIDSLIHYPIPIHKQGAYKELGHGDGDFPVTEQMCQEVLSLPMYPHLKREQVKYVCDSIKTIFQTNLV
ncbi:MAG: dTDP-4-amino-4,6-dideoxygalactose transaminase [Candidatus Omnitrophota bacterium]|jgi:dTDP-4-amino-4,6-dideoxygalactose transaminase